MRPKGELHKCEPSLASCECPGSELLEGKKVKETEKARGGVFF